MPTTIASTFLRLPCVVHHQVPGPADEYGNPTLVSTASHSRCWVAQQSRTDLDTGIEVEKWVGYFPPALPLDGDDTVEVQGGTYQVVSTPWVVTDPITKRPSHIEATLDRTR